jgi:hypothetical protein
MDWSIDTITAFINVALLLPLVLCLMEFYWITYRRGTPVLIAIAGGFMWALGFLAGKPQLWSSLTMLYFIALGLLVSFFIGVGIEAAITRWRKEPVGVSKNVRMALAASFVAFAAYLAFNDHLVSLVAKARQYTTPPEELAKVADSSLVWYSPALFKMLADNPMLPQKSVVALYQKSRTPLQQYRLLNHESMPCDTVKEFMEANKDNPEKAWMVAMAQRAHYIRCEIPEIYLLSDDELMERTPLNVLETMSSEFYGDEPPALIQEWIEKKRKDKREGREKPSKPLPLPH